MERNWLIRTTQKQILGPVTKSKVLEFLGKGALGLEDEVTSGNGYWFSLKEKDLVDKYLYGDLPQGYNPISESKSVLSRREHPEKTTSLNATPMSGTRVFKIGPDGPGALPVDSDLEYPDITIITQATNIVSVPGIKMPKSEDLEFPDNTLMNISLKSISLPEFDKEKPVNQKSILTEVPSNIANDDSIVYPKNDDLDYPTLSGFETQKNQQEVDLVLNVKTLPPDQKIEVDQILTSVQELKNESKSIQPGAGDKKLLHERKVKSTTTLVAPKEINRPPKIAVRPAVAENLKKQNDNYLMYALIILVLIIVGLLIYYYRNILNKPFPV